MKLVVIGNEYRKLMDNKEQIITQLFHKIKEYGVEETMERYKNGLNTFRKLIDENKNFINEDGDINEIKDCLNKLDEDA